eukprot:4157975-Pleurochrysis_carterae.AAC.4
MSSFRSSFQIPSRPRIRCQRKENYLAPTEMLQPQQLRRKAVSAPVRHCTSIWSTQSKPRIDRPSPTSLACARAHVHRLGWSHGPRNTAFAKHAIACSRRRE